MTIQTFGLEEPETASLADLARKVGRSETWARARLLEGLPEDAWIQRGKVQKLRADFASRALDLLQRHEGGARVKPAAETSYQTERARREGFEAELARVKLEKALGKLWDADQVVQAYTNAVIRTQRRVMQVPQQMASACVGQDAGTIQALLEGELRAALLELREEIEGRPMVDESRAQGSDSPQRLD